MFRFVADCFLLQICFHIVEELKTQTRVYLGRKCKTEMVEIRHKF